MQAIIKSDNEIIINGADSSERILLNAIVKKSTEENINIKMESIKDINGDVAGTSIVPAINQTNYYNYLSELQVFSDAKTATTFVHIGVFYIPND